MNNKIDIPQGWEIKKLGEVCSINRGASPRPINNYITHNNGVNWIKIGDTSPNELYINSCKEKIINEGVKHSVEVFIGDIILSNSMSFGRPYILNINGCIHDGWLVIRKYQKYLIKEFLIYMLSSMFIKIQYINYAAGSGVKNLKKEIVQNILVPIPPLEEQKKIADILLTWDKAITTLKEIIQQKELQKKGLMQNLLTGKKRLDGFNDEWKEVKLKNICNVTTGTKNTQDKVSNGTYPFVIRSEKLERINTYTCDEEAILTAGDGKIGEIFHYINGKFDFHQRVYKLSDFRNIYGRYLFYMFKKNFKKRVISMSAKSTVDSVRMEMITDMVLFIPTSIEEQKKIAEILMKADEEIELLNKQLELYTEQKKGLMQQLLTGKIRVN